MIAAMSPTQNGRPISPSLAWPDLEFDSDSIETDLASADLMRLLGEIDRIPVADLLVPAASRDRSSDIGQVS
jgi:hypothetical protein